MIIRPITTNYRQDFNYKLNKKEEPKGNEISFKTYNPARTKKAVQEMLSYGIRAGNFYDNSYAARNALNAAKTMDRLHGRFYLPKNIEYEPLKSNDTYAVYNPIEDIIRINYNVKCFDSEFNMSQEMKKRKSWFTKRFSTEHPGHILLHEFSHAAHWKNLVRRHGEEGAMKVWLGLDGTGVPTPIGRLITRFSLSDYAVDSNDMCEFLAESMTKNVASRLSAKDEDWKQLLHIDVGYSDIFTRKHKNRYSSPQAYIDYFTQQVWNGDIDGARKVAQDAEEYLARIENRTPNRIQLRKSSVMSVMGEFIKNYLDKRNDLRINYRR